MGIAAGTCEKASVLGSACVESGEGLGVNQAFNAVSKAFKASKPIPRARLQIASVGF